MGGVLKSDVPDNLWDLPFIDRGVSGIVFAIDAVSVIKTPTGGESNAQELDVERRIFERLGQHPRITKLLFIYKSMIVLERLQYPLRVRTLKLLDEGLVPSDKEILNRSAQAAEGLGYLHAKNVFQVDIGLHNMLLDWDDNIKYCDFSGSSIDGEIPTAAVSPRAQHPFAQIGCPTVQSELFSLGSAIYEISTAHKAYEDMEDPEIQDRYARGQYPKIDHLLLGRVIHKCWSGEYQNASEVVTEIRAIQMHILCNPNSSLPDRTQRTQHRNSRNTSYITSLYAHVCTFAIAIAVTAPFIHQSLKFPVSAIRNWICRGPASRAWKIVEGWLWSKRGR